ncbi:MAG: hypothetical protein ACLPYW_16080 [Acidimicrobiales bacterium]
MNRPESEDTVERVVRDAVERGRQLRRRRHQARLAVTGTLAAALLAGVLVLVSTAGSARSPSGTKVTTATQPGPSTTVKPPTTTTTTPGQDTVPVASHVPAGFEPTSFTSVSLGEWWLLGTASCPSGSGTCNAIVRTTNSGSSFAAMSSPPATQVTQIAFANTAVGYAYDPGLWETTNGGSSWTNIDPSGAAVGQLQVAGGEAYALACPDSTSPPCQAPELLVSSVHAEVSSSSWQKATTPVALSTGASLAVGGTVSGGSDLYILSGNDTAKPVLLYSSNGGASFTERVDPCTPALGGTLTTSADGSVTLWAACPTGTEARSWLSTNGGASWHQRAGGFVNQLRITAASATVALAWPGGTAANSLDHSGDGGSRFSVVLAPSRTSRVTWAGFSDPSRAYALVDTSSSSSSSVLYESNDGGATWSAVVIKS